jgi:acetyltransferase-like isoleucine patch superfamily enzyme
VQQQVTDPSKSALTRYQDVVVGSRSLWFTIKYELITGLGGLLPGALGLLFRNTLYPSLFKAIGKGTVFGHQVTVRHPKRIELGRRVVVADGCVLDGRGETNAGIRVGDDVVFGERASARCKDGEIVIGERVGIGFATHLGALGGNRLIIEDDVMIGPHAYLGGVSYRFDRLDIPMRAQGHDLRGGIKVGRGTWIGAGAMLLDGAEVGREAIVAAGAVVMGAVPDYAIVGGVPAKIIRSRKDQADPSR